MATSTVDKTIEEAQAAMTVKRAFGEPFEAHGLTIVPAARIAGAGAGGGGGTGNRKGSGWGTGFGLAAQPMGVYVIDDHDAHWVPITEPNRFISMFTAPLTALRSLFFGREPGESKVLPVPVPVKKTVPVRRPRARRRAQA